MKKHERNLNSYCWWNKPIWKDNTLYDSNYMTPWRRRWYPTPALLPGKSHGWRSLVGCSPWHREESDTTEQLHFHFSLSCIGEGNGNPLQRSCLENPRDRGAWWAAVYGDAQSRTRLRRLSSSSSSRIYSKPDLSKSWEKPVLNIRVTVLYHLASFTGHSKATVESLMLISFSQPLTQPILWWTLLVHCMDKWTEVQWTAATVVRKW